MWRLFQNLNIYNCCRIYKEVNRTIDGLAKKGFCNTHSNIWWLEFPRDVRKFAFEDYCGLSFNRVCKLFQKKKKKKSCIFSFSLNWHVYPK